MPSLSPITDAQLEALEESIRDKYRERIQEKGSTPEGLFWDSAESMRTRFKSCSEIVDFEAASVLDVGCGFGDFYGYLCDQDIEPDSYHGIDVSEAALAEARDQYGDDPLVSFERRNILLDPYEKDQFDAVVLFGALGHNLESIDNNAYIRLFMRTCFDCADTFALNALSQYRQGDWPREEFVYYYDPAKVFAYAQELTRNVRLRHDFDPIPQKEFIIVLENGHSDKSGKAVGIKNLEE